MEGPLSLVCVMGARSLLQKAVVRYNGLQPSFQTCRQLSPFRPNVGGAGKEPRRQGGGHVERRAALPSIIRTRAAPCACRNCRKGLDVTRSTTYLLTYSLTHLLTHLLTYSYLQREVRNFLPSAALARDVLCGVQSWLLQRSQGLIRKRGRSSGRGHASGIRSSRMALGRAGLRAFVP